MRTSTKRWKLLKKEFTRGENYNNASDKYTGGNLQQIR